jgi:hypothetical protein
MVLEGTRFSSMEDIKSNAAAELRKIPREASRRCFEQWQDRWSKCPCARKGPALKEIGERCLMSYHYSAIPPPFRELFVCPSYILTGERKGLGMCPSRINSKPPQLAKKFILEIVPRMRQAYH